MDDYKNIFYSSFVTVPTNNIDIQEMKYFSEICDSRLKFKITSTKGYFREIKYHDDYKYNLILDLKKLANSYDKRFIIEGMSGRFASFCINEDYKIENEYRIYWRHWSKEDGFSIQTDQDDNTYIEIKLDENNFSGIKIELIS